MRSSVRPGLSGRLALVSHLYCKDEAKGLALADVSVVLRYISILLCILLVVIFLCVYISLIYDPGNNNA